jgi:hypothetical protein
MSKIASSPAHEESNFALHPRRNPHSWFVFRLALGSLGAALVLLPLALPQSWIASIFGLVMFMTSILLPPLAAKSSEPKVSRPISGQVVLTGAEFSSACAIPVPVRLFVNSEQILAMKPDMQPAVVVPLAPLSSIFLQSEEHFWLLVLESPGDETVFSFRGVFAERNARRAESAIRTFIRLAPPEKPRARAAGA